MPLFSYHLYVNKAKYLLVLHWSGSFQQTDGEALTFAPFIGIFSTYLTIVSCFFLFLDSWH